MKFPISIIFFFSLIAAPAFSQNGSESLGLSMGFDYTSSYLWRGTYWYNNDGAVFPFLTFQTSGFALSYVGEYSEDYITQKDRSNTASRLSDNLHAADFGLDYTKIFEKTLIIKMGFWYFYFFREEEYTFMTGTISIILESIEYKPTLTYSHDYYKESKEKKDFYVQFGLTKEFEIKDAGLSFGIKGGYYNASTTNQRGFSDITLKLGVSATISRLTLNGSLNYVFVPGGDFYKVTDPNTGITYDDKHRTFATFGASYTF